jgi:glycosyltransferase involved in cell wall biosynthesis
MSKALVVMRGSLSTNQFVPSRSVSCRVIEPLSYLKNLAGSNFGFDTARPEEIQYESLSKYGSIIFCKHNTAETVALASEAKKRGLKVIYDIDDLIYRFTADSMAFDHMKNVDYLREHIEGADIVVISTPTLASILEKDFKLNARVIVPIGIDTDKYYRRDYDFRPQSVLFTNGDNIKITNFLPDFYRVFNEFLRAKEAWNFEVFGDSESYLKDFERYKFLGSLPWQEHKLFLMKHAYSFAIAPLGAEEESDEHKLFSSCKSPIKYLEYGALKIPGIYSSAFIYRNEVKNHETGLVVENRTDAWAKALNEMMDPELRKRLADAGFEDVHSRHHIKHVAAQWREILA